MAAMLRIVAICVGLVALIPAKVIGQGAVYFPDANLKAAVEAELGISDPDPTDMLALTELTANDSGITDLTGLEHALELRILYLENNWITDISPLSGLPELFVLSLARNQISDISPMSTLVNMAHLGMGDNDIADISALSGLIDMMTLNLVGNQITDITALSEMEILRSLWLNDNQISDISALSNLGNLSILHLNGNQIADITSISGLTNLTELSLRDTTQISEIDSIAGLTKLTHLWLRRNQITDVTALSELTELTYVDLGDNQVSDIGAMSGLVNLTELHLWDNQVSDISALSGLTQLTRLLLGGNQISDVSALADLTGLTRLELWSNQITDISPLSGLVNLEVLLLGGNLIAEIDGLSELGNLTELNLSGNSIGDYSVLGELGNVTNLDLSSSEISDIAFIGDMVNLTRLQLGWNEISDISALSGLTNLVELYLSDNQISDISALSGMGNLQILYLWTNQVSDISVLSELTLLSELYLAGNSISDISPLAELANLTYLVLEDNPLYGDAYVVYIPQIIENNPGIDLWYDIDYSAWDPYPGDGATVTDPNVVLTWRAGPGAEWHGVFFGTNEAEVMEDYGDGPTFREWLEVTSYAPGWLEAGVTYYWRIDEYQPASSSRWTGDVWSFTVVSGENDPVHFPDANLKAAVEAELGVTDPNVADMQALTFLEAPRAGISDLTGLEYALNLSYLGLNYNQIGDVTPISELTNLSKLWLADNPISDIDGLSGLVNLTGLDLSSTQVTDITALSGLVNLTGLWLGNNQISDITPLSGLVNLMRLYLGRTEIGDISVLSELTKLTHLDLERDGLTDVTVLSGLGNLAHLGLAGNQLSDINVLSDLTNLELLWLSDNQVSDIYALSELTKLTHLYLGNNQISDISALAGLTKLTALDLWRNQVSDIAALSGLVNMRNLWLGENQITDISPLAGMTELEQLVVGNNYVLSKISVLSGLTNLRLLDIGVNSISDITPLAGLVNLTGLWLAGNQIDDISSLAGLTNITILWLSNNNIVDISPLSGLVNLTTLHLFENEFTDISALSEMYELAHLDLRLNSLNSAAHNMYLPQIQENNPGVELLYDPSVIAWNPYPADGADFVEAELTLEWSAGEGALKHEIYFGTDREAVAEGDAGTFLGRFTPTAYSLDLLAKNRTYYWRIDEIGRGETKQPGDVWSFTVATPVFVDNDAPNDPWPNDPVLSDPRENGTWDHPYDSIQEAIDAAEDYDAVVVMAGTYRGRGNRDIDPRGKMITIRSLDGPAYCIVDCQKSGLGFMCVSGETPETVIEGFKIINGPLKMGGGMYCLGSSPTIKDCVINGCDPAMIVEDSQPVIAGLVEVVLAQLQGSGKIRLSGGATFRLSNVQVVCDITGTGEIHVPAGKILTVIGSSFVQLSDRGEPGVMGSIYGNGLLRVEDEAWLSQAHVKVLSVRFGGSCVIEDCRITTYESSLYGHIAVKDYASLINNEISASGDRYIDIDPATFMGTLEGNVIDITVQKAQGKAEAGLFELRGQNLYCDEPNCPSGTFVVDTVPAFDQSTWTIDRLELLDGAELTLVNRFDYQAPYDLDGNSEVLYVRELVLGADAILDVAFNRLYYENIYQHPKSVIVNAPLLGFSLDKILFDEPDDVASRVDENNFSHPTDPNLNRVHVEQVTGLAVDPAGVMQMRNLQDLDPNSPTFGSVVTARAKIEFAKCAEREVVVRVQYLFEETGGNPELVVYLSDVPELLDHEDPERFEHYMEVGRVTAPAYPRPGSVGSNRPGTFERTVSTGFLDLSQGVWIELELVESGQARRLMSMGGGVGVASSVSASSMVDATGVELIAHPTGVCMDLSGDYFPSENDFLIMIATCGVPADVDDDGVGSTHSMDVGFSTDAYVDKYDIASCDWLLHIPGHSSLCDLPLDDGTGTNMMSSFRMLGAESSSAPLADLSDVLEDVLIVGKRNSASVDRLYVFDDDAVYADFADPDRDECNVGIVRDATGQLCMINTEDGVVKLDGSSQIVVPPGKISGVTEPRYGLPATVTVGIQKDGSQRSGRPILDMAFDGAGNAYVVPVVVIPAGKDSYTAAAKLNLLGTGSPPYQIARLYSEPLVAQDSEYNSNPREIEIDDSNSVYVLNVHGVHESDILWKYPESGAAKPLELGNSTGDPNYYVRDPLAMCVSPSTALVYVAYGQYNPDDPNTSVIGVFSTETLRWRRSIEVKGMQHITGTAEDPSTGDLWVTGFRMDEIPLYPNPADAPFYSPYIAKVPLGRTAVDAMLVPNTGSCDLALPMAIAWTGQAGANRADADGDGRVTFKDFAVLASSWRLSGADPGWEEDRDLSRMINGPRVIDFFDVLAFTERWLREERNP